MSDEAVFGDDINKVRQLIGATSVLILNHPDIISDILDQTTFISFSENKHILEVLTYWFTNPGFGITETEERNEAINLIKSFIKRCVNKNAHAGVKLIVESGELVVKYTKRDD